MIASQHIKDGKPLQFYVDKMNAIIDKKIADIVADENWKKI